MVRSRHIGGRMVVDDVSSRAGGCTISHRKPGIVIYLCLMLAGGMLLYGCGIDERELIQAAKESASSTGIDVSNCNVSVSQEGNLAVVQFEPKRPHAGGGGKLYFLKTDEKYIFVKGVPSNKAKRRTPHVYNERLHASTPTRTGADRAMIRGGMDGVV